MRRQADARWLPSWLSGHSGRVRVCVETEVRSGATALALRDDTWTWLLPESLEDGDMLVTVLDCRPALVACVEVVEGDGESRRFARWVVREPLPWEVLAAVDGPASSGSYPDQLTPAQVEALISLLRNPPAVRIFDAQCDDEAAFAAALLRADWAPRACGVCEEPVHPADLMLHIDPGREPDELSDLLDEAVLVCVPCHHLLHDVTVEGLRRRARPSCPRCGLREDVLPILWGEPASRPDEDEVFVGGCALPGGPPPRWHCRSCRLSFGEEARPKGAEEPSRRRDVPLESVRALEWALGGDLENALTDYADEYIDMVEIPVDDEQNDVLLVAGDVSWTLGFPLTLDELFEELDEMTAHHRRAPDEAPDELDEDGD